MNKYASTVPPLKFIICRSYLSCFHSHGKVVSDYSWDFFLSVTARYIRSSHVVQLDSFEILLSEPVSDKVNWPNMLAFVCKYNYLRYKLLTTHTLILRCILYNFDVRLWVTITSLSLIVVQSTLVCFGGHYCLSLPYMADTGLRDSPRYDRCSDVDWPTAIRYTCTE